MTHCDGVYWIVLFFSGGGWVLSKAVSRWKGIAVYSPIINGRPKCFVLYECMSTALNVSCGAEIHKSFYSSPPSPPLPPPPPPPLPPPPLTPINQPQVLVVIWSRYKPVGSPPPCIRPAHLVQPPPTHPNAIMDLSKPSSPPVSGHACLPILLAHMRLMLTNSCL